LDFADLSVLAFGDRGFRPDSLVVSLSLLIYDYSPVFGFRGEDYSKIILSAAKEARVKFIVCAPESDT